MTNITNIKGKHNEAIVFTDIIEESAKALLQCVCDMPFLADCKIRIMPDVHAGKGCTIGTTMTLHGKAVPNMVGVDIGCGMDVVKLVEKRVDFAKLDRVIRQYVPSGRNVRPEDEVHAFAQDIDLSKLRCDKAGIDYAYQSLGTLGGGNHFIEVDKDDEGGLYLVIHSGSRHLGVEVANFYQEAGYRQLAGSDKDAVGDLARGLKAAGRAKNIPSEMRKLKEALREQAGPKEMAYVSGQLFDDYIHDMKLTQEFAALNRKAMAQTIVEKMGFTPVDGFTTIHNYIDTDAMILRKGAVAAHKGEKLLIPINMRDGSLVCVGKGNDDWNQSAPHGAGRLMSRSKAKKTLELEAYKAAMDGIFTTSVSKGTLDEAPMAYKSMEDIVKNIGPTVEIVNVIKPVYNFKAEE